MTLFTPRPSPDADPLPPELRSRSLASPAAAFSRQASTELAMTRALSRGATRFLTDVYETASRALPTLPTSAEVHAMWAGQLQAVLASLDHQERYYLKPVLEADTFADEVYETVRDLTLAAMMSNDSPNTIRAAMREALMLDSPGAQLTPPIPTYTASTDGNGVPLPDSLHVTGALTASIWDQLESTGSTWISKIRRTARTAATGLSGFVTLQGLSVTVRYDGKRWVTRHDDQVRPSHAAVDGTTIPLNQNFMVGGYPLAYPGERGGEYQEIVNCRCVLVGASLS